MREGVTVAKKSNLLAVCVIMGCIVSHANGAIEDFSSKVSQLGGVQLTGWARLQGELMIYDSRSSMEDHLKYPHCVSGVFANQEKMNLSSYNGRMVKVSGILYKYSDLPSEDSPVLPRKTLSGAVIPNFCFGDNVLLIKKVTLITPSK